MLRLLPSFLESSVVEVAPVPSAGTQFVRRGLTNASARLYGRCSCFTCSSKVTHPTHMETETKEDPASQTEIFGPLAAKHANLFLAGSRQGSRPPHAAPAHPAERAPKAQQRGHKKRQKLPIGDARRSPQIPGEIGIAAGGEPTGTQTEHRIYPVFTSRRQVSTPVATGGGQRVEDQSRSTPDGHPIEATLIWTLFRLLLSTLQARAERGAPDTAGADGLAEIGCKVVPEVGQHLLPASPRHGQRAGEARGAHAAARETLPAFQYSNVISRFSCTQPLDLQARKSTPAAFILDVCLKGQGTEEVWRLLQTVNRS